MTRPGKSLPERITPDQYDYGSRTAAVIVAGGIAAIPTETSYGLAVDAFNERALKRLFTLKQRPLSKPLLVLIPSVSALPRLAAEIPDTYAELIEQFWPGPLTLLFPALSNLPEQLTAGTRTVGIRISSNEIATEICRCAGSVITATSANISGHHSARSAEEVVDYFDNRIDIVVDGGKLEPSPGSSIVGCSRGRLVSIREGVIPFAAIQKAAAHSP
ncbi:MAG: threonylcarbamoyl-AMP synthase [Desulfofustis sp.]|jgi:L-threonylcarbamoyladenylate synthase|nr:threonylcarbamoyl-AMP synthase [Desulfofustis sp.]